MALSVDAINAITKRKFIPKLVDNITTSNALLGKIPKGNLDGGTDIRQPVFYAFTSSRGWYSGSETLDTAGNDKKTALVFDWAQFYVNITISKLDELKNAGDSKVIDHVKSEIMIAEESLKEDFGDGLYSDGTDSKELIGLRVPVATANTYGGIAQSTNSWLQAKVDSSSTALSIANMQERYEAASEPPDRPDLIPTTETLFNSYHALLQPQMRFSDSKMADGGFKNLLFHGAPVVEDSHCPANHMFFLNTKYLKLYSHSQRKFPGEFEDFVRIPTQDSMFGKIWWAGQLVCSQPRKQGLMSALTS